MARVREFYLKQRWVQVKDKAAPYGVALSGPYGVARVARGLIGDEPKENFLVFLLDNKNVIKGFDRVALGTMEACMVHPRDVFLAAVREGASHVVVVHNHPSGDTTPSDADRQLTAQLKKAGKLLGIPVIDHVIIGEGHKLFSFQDNGLM